MKAILSVLGLLVVLHSALAGDIGLYELSDNDRPTKSLTNKIERAELRSQSNDNGKYELILSSDHPFSLHFGKIGLVLGNQVIRCNMGGGGSESGHYAIGAGIDDTNLVPRLAQFFNAKVEQRHHPGYLMLVSFIPDKTEFALGEPVSARLRITNVGTSNFTFVQGGRQRGARDNQFAFSAESAGDKMLPDTGDPRNFGGLAGYVTLKPGESHEIPVDLTKWFAFTKAGFYQVRGSYYMEFVDLSASGGGTLWEDCACAEFTVRIKK